MMRSGSSLQGVSFEVMLGSCKGLFRCFSDDVAGQMSLFGTTILGDYWIEKGPFWAIVSEVFITPLYYW